MPASEMLVQAYASLGFDVLLYHQAQIDDKLLWLLQELLL